MSTDLTLDSNLLATPVISRGRCQHEALHQSPIRIKSKRLLSITSIFSFSPCSLFANPENQMVVSHPSVVYNMGSNRLKPRTKRLPIRSAGYANPEREQIDSPVS